MVNSIESNFHSLFNKRSLQIFLFFLILFSILFFNYFSFFFTNNKKNLKISSRNLCKWREEEDPQFFFLKTLSSVSYDGGHWFHIAENFMIQSKRNIENNLIGTSSEVYFITDRGKTL